LLSLVAIRKGLHAVKLCSVRILQVLTGYKCLTGVMVVNMTACSVRVCACLQELVADQQLSRAALKQSNVTSTSSGGVFELQSLSLTDSPHKPSEIALDPSSQQSTTTTQASSATAAGGDISSQQSQP